MAVGMAAITLASPAFPADPPHMIPGDRVASVYLSEDFINGQIRDHLKNRIVEELAVHFLPDSHEIQISGLLRIPDEDMRSMNLDPGQGDFRFESVVKPGVLNESLSLEFLPHRNFFYPAKARNKEAAKIEVPVHMLSLALASTRGYLEALSGNFSSFDRRKKTLALQLAKLEKESGREKDPLAREQRKADREALELKIRSVDNDRRQLELLKEEMKFILDSAQEQNVKISDEIAAKDNTVYLRLSLAQLVPYLKNISLEGIRVLHDKKDGCGQNYLAIDIRSRLAGNVPAPFEIHPSNRPGMAVAPSVSLRLNQSVLESRDVKEAESAVEKAGVSGLKVELKNDGIHFSGKKSFLLMHPEFAAVLNFRYHDVDEFDIELARPEINMGFGPVQIFNLVSFGGLNRMVENKASDLAAAYIQGILQDRFGSACRIARVEEDNAAALRVHLDGEKLFPAGVDMHLVGLSISERELTLKMGKVARIPAEADEKRNCPKPALAGPEKK
jgi:hypothetical protein